jgi:hypothetical protein
MYKKKIFFRKYLKIYIFSIELARYSYLRKGKPISEALYSYHVNMHFKNIHFS